MATPPATSNDDANGDDSHGAEKEERRLIAGTFSEEHVISPNVGVYTLEEGLSAAGVGLYQKLLLLYVGFAWVCDAMEMMLLSFLAPAADCEWNLSSAEKGLITSVVFIGMFIGAYSWGTLADSEGRKIGFLATAVFTVVWGFASAAAPNYAALLAFRAMVGLGIGGISVAFSLFLEFVPTENRGRYAIALQAFWTLGALFEAGVAWVVMPSLGWRYLLGISTIPFVILLFFFPFLSESPRFLAMKGKTLKAERVLERVAQWNGRELPNGKLYTRSPIQPHQTGPKGASYHVKKVAVGITSGMQELFSTALRRVTCLLFVIWIVHALIYYGLVLLTTELQSKDSEKCTADGKLDLEGSEYMEIFIDTAAEFVGFLFAFRMVDTLGRKRSIMIFMVTCGVAIWPLILSENSAYQTTLLFIGRAAIAGSFNTLYVYTPELFPTDVRAFGLGLSNSCSRIGGLIAPLFAVQLVDEGYASIVEILFAFLCFVACFAVFMVPIETMGRELQDTAEVQMTVLPDDGNNDNNNNRADVPSDEEIARL